MSNLSSPRPVRNTTPPTSADLQNLVTHELLFVQSTRTRRLSPGEEKSALVTPLSLLFGALLGVFLIAPLGFFATIVVVLLGVIGLYVLSTKLPNPWMVLLPMQDEPNNLRGSSVGTLVITALLTGLLPSFFSWLILLAAIAFAVYRGVLIYQNSQLTLR